ncbi:MAG: response regulator [Chloroflexota bacterium]
MSTKILLADDHVLLRQGIRQLIQTEPSFEVVAEANDGREAVEMTEQLNPDVLVLDVMLPELNGLEVLRTVKTTRPEIKVVMLSAYHDEEYVRESLRYGAIGYVLKDTPFAELLHAIREALMGHYYLCQPFNQHAINAYIGGRVERSADSFESLTTRERQVFKLTAMGMTSGQIGIQLKISPRTVEVHRANMMHKLHLRTHAEVTRLAINRGILSQDEVLNSTG